mgnify:CR=1 FL=1
MPSLDAGRTGNPIETEPQEPHGAPKPTVFEAGQTFTADLGATVATVGLIRIAGLSADCSICYFGVNNMQLHRLQG